MNTKFEFLGSPIKDIDHLAEVLDIDIQDILYAMQIEDEDKYSSRTIAKKDGRERTVYNPKPIFRKIQRRIKNRIFKQISWPDFVFGSIPADENSHDFIECAQQHCLAQSILKLDIEDFFDNISQDLVESIFKNFFRYSDSVSTILATLCCVDLKVPQGGITSSYLASIALHSLEENLFLRMKSKKLIYTRYVDDITISSKNRDFNFEAIINIVESLLNNLNLPLNKKKIEVNRFSSIPLTVHNIRVDFKNPRYDKTEVKNIRAAIHRLSELAKKPNHRTHYYYRIDFNRCQGLISKLKRVNHQSYIKLQNKLNKINPLPNDSDIKYIEKSIKELQIFFPKQTGEGNYIYNKKFFKIQQRIGFLKSHPKKIYDNRAFELNTELQLYRIRNKV
ncbi:reverse transcriptase family protein [Acinetobacter sp. MYb177]|uniref:reverse transcriptase family protein n=1 Tax=Acinetobacter sp. MYb177 TaxID=1848592 RepID=UPI0030A78983